MSPILQKFKGRGPVAALLDPGLPGLFDSPQELQNQDFQAGGGPERISEFVTARKTW